jgi:hypothetical protein
MNAILKRLHQLGDDDLLTLSEAIDAEVEHRLGRSDGIPDSARRRALARDHSYRRCNGAAAPPIRAIGLRDTHRRAA